MNTSFILLSSFWFLLHIEVHVHAEITQFVLLRTCPPTSNFTSNSPFESNLNTLLRSLYSNGTRNGYFSSTVGASPDTVYGLVNCRGDLSMSDCGICLKYTIVELTQRCPYSRVAMLRDEYCLLRYSTQSFLSERDDHALSLNSSQTVADADFATYNSQLTTLMTSLSITAGSIASRYASRSISDIYGLAQCTRDLTIDDCISCLQNMITAFPICCNRSVGARIFSTTCNIRYELFPFTQVAAESPQPPVDDSLPPLPPRYTTDTTVTQEGEGTGKVKSANVVVIAVPIVAAAVLLFAISGWLITKRNQNIYDGDKIRNATNDFSDANKLAEGGFGAVYKGGRLYGQDIAVKILSKNLEQGSKKIKNEVVLIQKLQHPNLVRLLGFTLSGEKKLLIYEYVPNGSLDKYIFDKTEISSLDWGRRYKIVRGIAQGLLYLHEDSQLHRYLKAGNILLDKEMNPKIADFGMAKLFVDDQTHGIDELFGYMAGEYAMQGLFSDKSDVYSFGVLLLEIVSGKKASDTCKPGNSRDDLLSYAWNLWSDAEPLKFMDPRLTESFTEIQVMRCIHIGLLCVQDNIQDRPTMSSVVLFLNSDSPTLQSPTQPLFHFELKTHGIPQINKVVESNESTSSSLLHFPDGVPLGKKNPIYSLQSTNKQSCVVQ